LGEIGDLLRFFEIVKLKRRRNTMMNVKRTQNLFCLTILILLIHFFLFTKSLIPQSSADSVHHHNILSIPEYFAQIIDIYSDNFYQITQAEYESLCAEYQVLIASSNNKRNILTVIMLHELFTSKTASNFSRGDILNIPYLWHWISPNPRYEIRFTNDGSLLCDMSPP
jgi:hypothetical protein